MAFAHSSTWAQPSPEVLSARLIRDYLCGCPSRVWRTPLGEGPQLEEPVSPRVPGGHSELPRMKAAAFKQEEEAEVNTS